MNYHSWRGGGFGENVSARSAFLRARKVEASYARQLRKIARHIGELVSAFDPNSFEGQRRAQEALRRYADTLEPWAEAVADRMVKEVAARDRLSWKEVSAEMGRALHREIENAPTGAVTRQLVTAQVGLIKSLPLEAADRVQKLSIEALYSGARPETIAKEIMRSGEVSKSRANLIARTEAGRASTSLTQARAQYVGSPGYVWSTSKDAAVRPSHKAMQGQFVAWDSPPTLDGMTGHAGCLPRCRCWPSVVLPPD